MKRVVVLDYGSGNLRSAERALARVGADVTVTADARPRSPPTGWSSPASARSPPAWPGSIASAAAPSIAERIAAARPVLGICVGMQVLFDAGVEHGVETAGLGVLPGRVERLRAPVLPHMGWNTVVPPAGSDAVRRASARPPGSTSCTPTRSIRPRADRVAITTARRGLRRRRRAGPVSATQFHPEKSGDAGAAVLDNWLSSL